MSHQSQAIIPDVPLLVLARNDEVESTTQALLTTFFSFPAEVDVLNHPDIHWLNTSDEAVSIDHVRKLQELISFKPYEAAHSFFILCQVEQASLPAQQALLKTLEEPPAHVRLLLFTTKPDALLPTITSRTQLYTAQSESTTFDEPAAAELYTTLKHGSWGEAVAWGDSIGDRTEAKATLENLLQYLHHSLTTPNSDLPKDIQLVLEALTKLQANANVKLVVTELGFGLKKQE